MITFHPKNSGGIQLSGLVDKLSTPPKYINDATVEATLFDGNKQPVAGFQDVVGEYITGSNGDYRFTVPAANAFDPPPGSNYTVVVTVTTSTEGVACWTLPAIVVTRN